MKAARYYGPGNIRIEEIPEPVPKPGQVKIKVAWNGICGSDLHSYLTMLWVSPATEPNSITKEKLPVTMGHEMSGTIVELGEGVDTNHFSVGQNVVVEPLISCMNDYCASCLEGRRNVCPSMNFIGIAGWGGGLAEYITVDQELVHILPPRIPLEAGAMIEPLAVGWHAVNRSEFKAGNNVLVVGAGPIGLLLVKVLRARGASWIGVSEPAAARCKLALALGADDVFDPLTADVSAEVRKVTGGSGADVVFECSGIEAGLHTALNAVRARGNIVNISVWEKPPAFDVNLLMMREATFTATIGYESRVFPDLLRAVGEGKLDGIEALVTRKIALEEVVEKGIKALLHEKDTQIKILVHP
ncbi:alcohol dehydrogenase GroES domain protein [Obba rivulosa]|uniref:Alcohol dehydrogenase GroES domain protein n=1 Tax=Obba rivulosa TaxID=1052685 RepID=A0A8E2AZP5_9APHY|nr:alcohol dehydrogenase GroES domain protein [Obba rivulosa]